MQPARAPAPLIDVVVESLDEAEFLWRTWEQELDSPLRDLEAVWFWVEQRLQGALDGVQVAGDAAIDDLLVPALREPESRSRAIAAAYVLACEASPRAVDALVSASVSEDDVTQSALARGVQLAPAMSPLLEAVLAKRGDRGAALCLEASNFQQRPAGPALDVVAALRAGDAGVRSAAIRALRHLAPAEASAMYPAIGGALAAPDLAVRDAALETGMILGLPAAWARCLELAAAPGAAGQRARLLVALLGTERDQRVLLNATGDEPSRRDALFALGCAGTPEAADACLQIGGAVPELARLATDSFVAVTGVDLAAEGLLAPPPPAAADEPIAFEEEDLDADLRPTPDQALPLADWPRLTSWWQRQQRRFAAGRRYLRGQPLDALSVQRFLREGSMRRRHATALEVAVRSGGRHQVETRAFAREQRRQLSALATLDARALSASPLVRQLSVI